MRKIKANPLMMFLFKDIGLLEHDARSQYKFNRFWAIVWFMALVAIPFLPRLYGHDVGTMLVLEVSLWANFATHFSGMSSALAAVNTTQTVTDMSDDVDDIHTVAEVLHPEILNNPSDNLYLH